MQDATPDGPFRLSAIVRASGTPYGELNGARFDFASEGDSSTWVIWTPAGDMIRVTDGEQPAVSVRDHRVPPPLVPKPWGLLLGLQYPSLHGMGSTLVSEMVDGRGRSVHVYADELRQTSVIIHESGFVEEKHVDMTGGDPDGPDLGSHIALTAIKYIRKHS